MQCNSVSSPLIVIIGPTAVGKTEFSLEIAERFKGEIISADSRLFFRGMNIGTAKPGLEERKGIQHHLIDIAAPDETIGLADFKDRVNRIINQIHEREHIPFMVGGTGQFIKSVVEGWNIPPQAPHPEMRRVLAEWAKDLGPFEFHNRLAQIDPQAADFIQPQNVRRVIRAFEVVFTTGVKFSDLRQKNPPPFHSLMIGITRSRQELYSRVDARIEEMLQRGFLNEVRELIEIGYTPDLPSFSAIGYSEMAAVLDGKISLEEAKTIMRRRTREYIRRQANWFKEDDPRIHWVEANSETVIKAAGIINEFLKYGIGVYPTQHVEENRE